MTEHATDSATGQEEQTPPVTTLTPAQRRVLGVLLEKAFTTPEYYPLTLKAVVTGCNQKSNRAPVTHYGEAEVVEVLDELRKLGLVGEVHPESGRTSRYRHYMRHKFSFTEPQLAILTELFLRGRQQLGELRSRAARMVAVDSLDALRSELRGLLDQGCVRSTGALEKRGVEVDHTFYETSEAGAQAMPSSVETDEPAREPPAPQMHSAPVPAEAAERLSRLETTVDRLQQENRSLRESVETLNEQLDKLNERFEDLRRDLGG